MLRIEVRGYTFLGPQGRLTLAVSSWFPSTGAPPSGI